MIFANIMSDKKNLGSFWKKALRKYRFVVMTADSFEEKLSVKLSWLNVFAFAGALILFSFFSAILLFTTTPLAEYVPGKSSSEVQRELVSFSLKSDSLLAVLSAQDAYLQNINSIINGGELATPKTTETQKDYTSEITFKKSIDDSVLRASVESEEKGVIRENKKKYNEVLLFFTPINGVVTERFDAKTKHFGIDLVAKEKTRVSAVLPGTVVISNWTSETGYVIGVQHKNAYFSLYKHNSVLLRSAGDVVSIGEPIAIVGNSGEFSSGPHLHFELWKEGVPVDPENYILF